MPRRDYAARSKKKKGSSKSLILAIILFLLVAGGIGLWMLKENAPTPVIPLPAQNQPARPPQGPVLPSRPEEVYSYIRDLETREVLTDNSQKSQEKLAQLSAEQKQQLEAKLKQEEAARSAAAEKAAQPDAAAQAEGESATALTPEQLAAQEAERQKAARLAEEKRKQAEQKRQEAARQNQVPVETAKTEKQKKAEQTKVTATAAKQGDKTQNLGGRFGLQCGAFKNKAQAENMQARLAMAGFNARITTNADWNRVIVGPVGDRAAASNAQSNTRSVAECVIISM